MKRQRTLQFRLMAAALLPISLLALLVGLYMITLYRSNLGDWLQQRGQLLTRQLAVAADYGVFSGNINTLQSLVESVEKEKSVVGVLIASRDGRVLAHSRQTSISTQQLATILAGKLPAEKTGFITFSAPIRSPRIIIDDFDQIRQESTFSNGQQAMGVAIVELSTTELKEDTRRFAFAVSATLFLVLLGAWWWSKKISLHVAQPILDIAEAVKRIGRGAEGVRIPAYDLDTLQILGNGVNQMASRLELSRHELEGRIAEATRQLRSKKEEAEQANQAKSRFLAAASHDLRQPMHALGMFIASLARQTHPPESRQLITHIDQAVAAMGELLDSLLDISRLDAGIIEAAPADFPLQAVFDRLASNFIEPAETKGLELVIRHTSLWVHSDRILLERVLGNLISNAVRYTKEGRILVAARRRRGEICIEVRDSGIGIPQEAQQTIFHEFVQLSNPERDRSKGLGLGLAIVKRLISLLDHQLVLRSRLGQGSIFALYVPTALPALQLQTMPSTMLDEQDFSGMKILVIDDDALVREGLASLLHSWGCKVIQDAGNQPPFALLNNVDQRPEIILCDLRLAGPMNGRDMIDVIRAHLGVIIPAAIITGDTDPETLREAGETGLAVLMKPLRPAQLRTLLRALVRQTMP